MSWNYRVIEEDIDGEIERSICEVYYEETGDICSWSSPEKMTVYETDTFERLFNNAAKALEKPVLVERIVNGRRCLVKKEN